MSPSSCWMPLSRPYQWVSVCRLLFDLKSWREFVLPSSYSTPLSRPSRWLSASLWSSPFELQTIRRTPLTFQKEFVWVCLFERRFDWELRFDSVCACSWSFALAFS